MHKCVQLVEIQRVPLFATSKIMNKSIHQFFFFRKKEKVKKIEWMVKLIILQSLLYAWDKPWRITVVKSHDFLNKVRICIILQFFQLDKLFVQEPLQRTNVKIHHWSAMELAEHCIIYSIHSIWKCGFFEFGRNNIEGSLHYLLLVPMHDASLTSYHSY